VFYQGILASVLFFAVLCWGGSITVMDKNRINKIIKKAGSVIGLPLDSLETTIAKRTKTKLNYILCFDGLLLYHILYLMLCEAHLVTGLLCLHAPLSALGNPLSLLLLNISMIMASPMSERPIVCYCYVYCMS